MDIISPTEFVRISHDEYVRNFPKCVDAINAGTIFLVYGNEHLYEIYKRSILPRYKTKDRKYFGLNPEDLHKNQNIQRALFSNLSHEHIFVDSSIRLRMTHGQGAFVGPHIDFYEGLPRDGINCWISFSSLEASEAIQFLPSHFHPQGENMSGHFKEGVHLHKSNKLMPSSKLIKEAKSHPINPCEYFVFNSGRMVHCSPFYVKRDRVTCDQRIFRARDPKDANFGELLNWYCLEDQSKFDGVREVRSILNELWSVYQTNFNFPICHFRSDIKASPDRALEIARDKKLDPSLFLREMLGKQIDLNHLLISDWLKMHTKSVSLRMHLLDFANDSRHVDRLSQDLLSLIPENQSKVYKKLFSHPALTFSNLIKKKQYSCIMIFGILIRLINSKFGKFLPGPLRVRLHRRFAIKLFQKLHPETYKQNL
jgi:hypothetical protein